MKTHRVAKLLRQLADVLELGPDTELDRLGTSALARPGAGTTASIAVNLDTLAELSRLDKTQWAAFITDLDLPIPVRPRDASRDILGKLLRYLENSPDAREKLRQNARRRASEASPELMKALDILLRDTRPA